MSKGRGKGMVRHAVRPGEGTAMQVSRLTHVGVDGKSTAALGVNLAEAPVPDRKYLADGFKVVFEDGVAQLLFGQLRTDGQGLRSLLVIHLGGEAADHFLGSTANAAPNSMTFEDSLKSLKFEAAKPMNIQTEPAQTVALKATALYSAFSGVDSCVDFYQISPAAIHASRNSSYVGVEPVVRVDMRTPVLMGMLDTLKQHADAKQAEKESKS